MNNTTKTLPNVNNLCDYVFVVLRQQTDRHGLFVDFFKDNIVETFEITYEDRKWLDYFLTNFTLDTFIYSTPEYYHRFLVLNCTYILSR